MRNALLVQVGTGPWRPVLAMLEPYHRAYAERHGMEYRPIYERRQPDRHPIWCKIAALREALDAGYGFVVVLDADALVVQPAVDLRRALTFGDLGLCCHQHPWMTFHLNTGASYVRNTERTQELYRQVWEFPYLSDWDASEHPLGARDGEQHSVNRVLEQQEFAGLEILHARWQSCVAINPTRAPIVKAWHGIGGTDERAALMAAELQRLNPYGEWDL